MAAFGTYQNHVDQYASEAGAAVERIILFITSIVAPSLRSLIVFEFISQYVPMGTLADM